MPIAGLDHAVLSVRDPERSVRFYETVLGSTLIAGQPRGPDGFEIAWIVPADRLDDAALEARKRIRRLDLEREMERDGAETQGGIGVSRRMIEAEEER